jgi:membrane associated rhomboid family serine protease
VTQPDLFVVCKNCGSEVSPYVTECPYCGQRVRKRAPKLDRGAPDEAPQRRRRARLPRLRADEIEGIAPEKRPYGTFALIAISLAVTLVAASGLVTDGDFRDLTQLGGIAIPDKDDPWRFVTAPFVHDSLGYQFVALVAVAIFGTLIERRFGALATIAVFLLTGAAGCALAVGLEAPALFDDSIYAILGANGAALGLLTAWLVDHRRAARRGHERGADLIGVYVVAAVLVLLSLAAPEANIAAAAGGAAAGGLLGLALPLFTRR